MTVNLFFFEDLLQPTLTRLFHESVDCAVGHN